MSTLFAMTILNAKPKERPYKMFDGGGLHLFVKPNGSKLWRLTYSWMGKQKTLSLGQWPDLGLADARGKRDEARRLLAGGIDPSHQQKIDAARARIEENDSFKSVALEWIAKNEREGMAEITLSKIRWLLDIAYPKIGGRPVAKITAQEVLAVLRSVEATGRYESARRMRSVLGRAQAIDGFRCKRSFKQSLQNVAIWSIAVESDGRLVQTRHSKRHRRMANSTESVT